MRFIETSVFTAALRRHLDDETYRALQLTLLFRPTQGPILRGGAGLRKLRWAASSRGKRGGVRLIYYWESETETFYMSNNLNSGADFDIHGLDDGKVGAIQTVSDPKQRREESDRPLQLRCEVVEGFMLFVRMRPPVVAGDIRDHRELLGRKAAQLTVGDQVIRMLVMRAFVDEVPDVMAPR